MSSTVGVDYELATIVVQFQMAPDTMCRSFTILEDTEKEPVETFGVLLETSDPAVQLTDTFAIVSINDSTGISTMLFVLEGLHASSEMYHITVLVSVLVCCCCCWRDFTLLTVEGEQARLHTFNSGSRMYSNTVSHFTSVGQIYL